MKLTGRVLLLVVLGVLALPVFGQGKPEQGGMPAHMPQFQLISQDGTTVDSQKLPQTNKWLLIYVRPNCQSCERVLRLIRPDEHPDLPQLMTIIVGGATADQVKNMAKNYQNLAAATWYADPQQQAGDALKVPGVPVIFGVRKDILAWHIMGMLSDDTQKMTSIFVSWGK